MRCRIVSGVGASNPCIVGATAQPRPLAPPRMMHGLDAGPTTDDARFGRAECEISNRIELFANAARRQRTNQRTHHGQGFLAAWETLAHQVIGSVGKFILLQSDILSKAVEEGKFKVGCLSQSTVGTDLHTIATEDTAIQRERI